MTFVLALFLAGQVVGQIPPSPELSVGCDGALTIHQLGSSAGDPTTQVIEALRGTAYATASFEELVLRRVELRRGPLVLEAWALRVPAVIDGKQGVLYGRFAADGARTSICFGDSDKDVDRCEASLLRWHELSADAARLYLTFAPEAPRRLERWLSLACADPRSFGPTVTLRGRQAMLNVGYVMMATVEKLETEVACVVEGTPRKCRSTKLPDGGAVVGYASDDLDFVCAWTGTDPAAKTSCDAVVGRRR